jgi:putative tryptophan/tyrosine transport system substrate-binding protein
MAIKTIVVLLVSLALPASRPAEAQQQAKVPKIGLLGARPAASSTGLESFRREFGKLGYVEGRNIAFEYRSADNKLDRLPALADELVRLKVDVLVTPGTAEALALKNAKERSPSFFSVGVILLRLGWLTAWRGPAETSRGSPALGQCWLAND